MRHYTRADFEKVFENMLGDPLPGVTPQPVHEVSTVQRHVIGARLVQGDRVFHYAHALAAVLDNVQGWGVINGNTIHERAGATWARNGVIGDLTALLTAKVEDVAEDQFAGGYLLFADADTGDGNQIPILHNSAATIGNTFTVWLGHPLTGSATLGVTGSTCVGSIFGNVCPPGTLASSTHGSIVGVPIINIPTGNFGWVLTWGPCLAVATGVMGEAANTRRVVFNSAGSIQLESTLTADFQHAGFVAPASYYAVPPAGAAGHSTNFFILQLFP